jgi:hypothetical protein
MENFVAEMPWETSDAQRIRKALHGRCVQTQNEYTGVLEQISTLIGTPLRTSPSRGSSRGHNSHSRSPCETFPIELADPAMEECITPEEAQPVVRHVTFEDIGSIVAKVKKARGNR